MNGGGGYDVDPYYKNLAAANLAAQRSLAAQMADPMTYARQYGHPLVHYVHPEHLAALYRNAQQSPYYGAQYHSYATPASAWYQSAFTAGLPHVANIDVAPVVSDSGAAAQEASRRISAALSPAALEIAAARARAAQAAAAGAGRQAEGELAMQSAALHPLLTEVETQEIPRCFTCDRAVEECRLECQTFDSVAATYNSYQFNAVRFAGEPWFQERTGVTSIPKVTPETAREFCTTRIGGEGSFHSVFMKTFHVEFCMLARLVKREDLLSKFGAVQQHAFRRAIDVACHDGRYADLCLPPRLEETSCIGTCGQCQAVVTSALNAATGGDGFDCAAFHRVMNKELGALGLDKHKRSVDALAYRARQLFEVTTQLTGRSDRDKLVITENLCASFNRPSCGCTVDQVDADGAGKKVAAPAKPGAASQGTLIIGEGEHVVKDGVKDAILRAQGQAASVTLESEAADKKAAVDTLKQKEEELKAKIAKEETAAKELEVASNDSAQEEQAVVVEADKAADASSGAAAESGAADAAASDEDSKVEKKIAKDKAKIKKAEKKLKKLKA